MKFNIHWGHWRSHIIIFGITPIMNDYPENKKSGLEITLFGYGFQFFANGGNLITWLLVNVWNVPLQNFNTPQWFLDLNKGKEKNIETESMGHRITTLEEFENATLFGKNSGSKL
jgi:hypothetical protein